MRILPKVETQLYGQPEAVRGGPGRAAKLNPDPRTAANPDPKSRAVE
jgi:hypothetical protein